MPLSLAKIFVGLVVLDTLLRFLEAFEAFLAMIFLKHDQKVALWVYLDLRWSVASVQNAFGKEIAELFQLDDAQGVVGNGNETILRTLVRAEPVHVEEGVIRERRHRILPHQGMTQEGLLTEGDERVLVAT